MVCRMAPLSTSLNDLQGHFSYPLCKIMALQTLVFVDIMIFTFSDITCVVSRQLLINAERLTLHCVYSTFRLCHRRKTEKDNK